MRREKSLRIGVHHADAVVWGPVCRTRLRRSIASSALSRSSVDAPSSSSPLRSNGPETQSSALSRPLASADSGGIAAAARSRSGGRFEESSVGRFSS